MKHYDPSKNYVMSQTKVIEGELCQDGSPVPELPRHTLDLFLQHHIIREAPVVVEPETPPPPAAQAKIEKDKDGYFIVYVGGMPMHKPETKGKKPAVEWCEKQNLTYDIS
jgi:hypothetical protein